LKCHQLTTHVIDNNSTDTTELLDTIKELIFVNESLNIRTEARFLEMECEIKSWKINVFKLCMIFTFLLTSFTLYMTAYETLTLHAMNCNDNVHELILRIKQKYELTFQQYSFYIYEKGNKIERYIQAYYTKDVSNTYFNSSLV
jgi:hypothetical protein